MTKQATRRESLTLDELIDALVQVRLKSPLKGQTVPHICIPDHEYQAINEVKLTDTDAGDENNPSGVALIFSDSLDEIVEELGMDALIGDPFIDLGPLHDASDFDPRDGVNFNDDEIDDAPDLEE
jgi:hypothetical protein